MSIMRNFSPKSLAEHFGQSFKRFPVAMLLTLLLGGFLIYLNHNGSLGDKKDFFFIFYPATGAVLAVALALIAEDFKSRTVAVVVQVLVHALWLAVSVYLSGFDHFSTPQLIAVSATIAAMSLAVFVACFYRKHQDVQFWNFSIRTVVFLGLSFVIGGLLTLGLNLFLESLKMLFGIDVDSGLFMDIAAVCMTMLAPTLFMNLIPKGESKHLDVVVEFSHFAKGVVQYLFIPLLALYMITLYIYAAQILFQWKLPVGGVSYLVSGSMVLMILLIYITYPVQHQDGNRLFKGVTRCLPVVMFPLLALMTVAVGRRLSDYGITVSRLYLLVFNFWCYAVCLWLIFTRNKRIWLIPASFALILLLISVGPQSIPNATLRQLKNEARSAFSASGLTQFPLSGDQYEKWLLTVDKKTAASIDSKLDYLQDFYRYKDITDLVSRDAEIGTVARMEDDKPISYHDDNYANWELFRQIKIPDGYRFMEWMNNMEDQEISPADDIIKYVLSSKSGLSQTFEVNKRDLIALDSEKWQDETPDPFILTNDEAMLIVSGYAINYSHGKGYLRIDGLLLTK